VVKALTTDFPNSLSLFTQLAESGYPAIFRADEGKNGEEKEWNTTSVANTSQLSNSFFPYNQRLRDNLHIHEVKT